VLVSTTNFWAKKSKRSDDEHEKRLMTTSLILVLPFRFVVNIVELLMVEHVSLRLHFQFARKTANWDSIYDVEEFVRDCHAKIEDEVVFPKLQKSLKDPDRENHLKNLSRLEADHRLIGTIGEQIRLRTTQGTDLETLRKRILLYATTVESHNASEESLIFPYWNESGDDLNEVIPSAMRIVREYGLNRYFQITGISERLLELVT
jgi:hemerythrin superfamily protein